MTEADWRAAIDVPTLLRWAVPRGSRRQLRLYLCGGCRQIADQFYHPACLGAVEAAERHADSQISAWDFGGAAAAAECLMYDFMFEADFPHESSDERDAIICRFVALGALPAGFQLGDPWVMIPAVRDRVQAAADLASHSTDRFPEWYTADDVARRVQRYLEGIGAVGCWPGRWLVDCVYGNPFRPPGIAPDWRTPTVLALAEAVYADRGHDRLPVLADALEDAGCADPAVLTHCRGGGPHVRGCWVIDRLLDKPDEPATQAPG